MRRVRTQGAIVSGEAFVTETAVDHARVPLVCVGKRCGNSSHVLSCGMVGHAAARPVRRAVVGADHYLREWQNTMQYNWINNVPSFLYVAHQHSEWTKMAGVRGVRKRERPNQLRRTGLVCGSGVGDTSQSVNQPRLWQTPRLAAGHPSP